MDIERWRKVEETYHAALERQPAFRAEFVRQACAGDEALEQEVLSLLAESDDGENFLEEPAMHVAAQALAESSDPGGAAFAAGSLPATIGRYRILGILGEGGMGAVYEAEQEEPRRIVALKVIRPGLATPERLRRFRHESQALGRLQHPGIAQIHDAGTADTGFGPQPYFAMELIRGLPLDRYAEQNKLTTRQKLELMKKICDAVHHAHQRGLVHRDLKPGNILVDETGQPKILDFGIARLTAQETPLTFQTEVGQIVGTLAYMSPEQVRGDPNEVDIRSDVYSLGVILFELLSGKLPYNVSGRQIHEAARTILETEAESLSSISRIYRGDLETIVGKALEKDKTRRYESAAALAADLENHLNDQPILARPPTTTYQLRKFARRHRALVTGIAAAFVVLLAGIAVSTTLAIRARRAEQAALAERDRANRERDRATRITDFMTGMFRVSDPGESRGNTVTAREILDKASNDIGASLASDPDAQTQMMQVMAATYANLGLYSRSYELATRALDARRTFFGPEDAKTLESMTQVGDVLELLGRYDEAERTDRRTLAVEERVLGSDSLQTLETVRNLAIVLAFMGHYDESENLYRRLVDTLARKLGPENDQTLLARANLAGLLFGEGHYVEAEKQDRSLLEIERRVWGNDSPRTLQTTGNLGMALRQEGQLKEAEHVFRGDLATEQRVEGPEHPDALFTMQNLAEDLMTEGKLADSERIYRQAIAILVRTLGPTHPDTLRQQTCLAAVLIKKHQYQDAERIDRAALAAQLKALGPENPDTLTTRSELVEALIDEHRYDEAVAMGSDLYRVQLHAFGPQHPDTVGYLRLLGMALAYQHRYPEAVSQFKELIDAQGDAGDADTRWVAWYALASVAAAAGNASDAFHDLQEAVHRGYSDADGLINDDDLKGLHPDPRFQEIVAHLKSLSASAHAP